MSLNGALATSRDSVVLQCAAKHAARASGGIIKTSRMSGDNHPPLLRLWWPTATAHRSTADAHGIAEIVRATGKAKTVIWRWQERFGEEGVAGLWCDKTRPSRSSVSRRSVFARRCSRDTAILAGWIT